MEYKIPLKNNKGEILDYCYVSKEDYDILNKFKWYKDSFNYVKSKINNKYWRIHRYIMIEILKNDIKSNVKIDHCDNNTLNNTRENLRIVTDSENMRNRTKIQNTTSKYIGVHWSKHSKKWQTQIKINGKRKSATYIKEEHAAHHYNLACKEYNLITAKLNIIPDNSIIDFVQHKKKDKINNLPKNISLISSYNKYNVTISAKHIGNYKTLLEAIITRNFKLKEIENKKQDDILNIPIKRNKENQPIIEIFNINKEKIYETIVDEDIYYDLMKYSYHISLGYVLSSLKIRLHRYVMDYTGLDIVDHINGNKLDNRKVNLRIITHQQNMFNKLSNCNSTSNYIGVSYNKEINKWESYITHNLKKLNLGYYEKEEEAAKSRDVATKKYYKEYGKLNFENP